MQVFDEYGVGTMPAFPMDNLIKDLNLKVSHRRTQNPEEANEHIPTVAFS
jgi:hypothetical protein